MSVIEMNVSDDLFEGGTVAIVNPVNAIGVAGLGLALKFKEAFPVNHAAYERECAQRRLQAGGIFVTEMVDNGAGLRYVVNLATKQHFRDASQIEWVQAGAARMRVWAEGVGCRSIATPALGAGLGQLEWGEVRRVLSEEFSSSGVVLHMYPPKPGPAYGQRRFRSRP